MPPIPSYLVTGATRGIGRSVAMELANRGFRVYAVGRSKDLLDSLSELSGALLTPVCADLATKSGVKQVAISLNNETKIDGIVHSAGSLVPLEPCESINVDDLVEHFRIHVGAPMELSQSVGRNRPIKRIMYIDSYSASTPRQGWGAYSIVKAAAQMSARCTAQELPETRVIRVFPGVVNTQVVDAVLASNTETATTFAGLLKKGEFAEPHQVATFLVGLLVDATDKLLSTRESFDYNNPDDRSAIANLS
ncbi:MAG: SDR family oxidoreductase [Aureliella sp.]